MTTENNKIIAEFMGARTKSPKNLYVFHKWRNDERFDWIDTYNQSELKFHSDWNWLMEVINKLTTLNEFQDYEFKSLFWDTFCQLDIEEVYTQVVLFIEWYNEQKKE